MIDFRKLALLATLIVSSAPFAFAQHEVTTTGTGTQDQAPPEAAAVDTTGERRFPAGWSLSAGGSVMEFFDTNPLMTPTPSSDSGEQFMGRIDITNMGERTSYVASYIPSYWKYRRFSALSNFSHAFEQNIRHTFSKKNSMDWSVVAQQYPSWSNNNSLSGSSIGALIMSLTGLTQLDLVSKVSVARTGLGLTHVLSRRSTMRFGVSGGVFHYGHSSDNPYASLFLQPDSNTWTGAGSFLYDYQIDKRRSVGIGAGHTYILNTLSGDHMNVESVAFRYTQQFANNWSVSVSVGPSFVLGADPRPSVDFSLLASRTSKRGVFRAELQHRFEPAIEPGHVTSWTGRLSYEYALSRRWVLGAYGVYQRSGTLEPSTLLDRHATQLYMAAGQAGYRIRPHVTWFVNYGYSVQALALTGYVNRPRQQVMTGISFELDGLLRQ